MENWLRRGRANQQGTGGSQLERYISWWVVPVPPFRRTMKDESQSKTLALIIIQAVPDSLRRRYDWRAGSTNTIDAPARCGKDEGGDWRVGSDVVRQHLIHDVLRRHA